MLFVSTILIGSDAYAYNGEATKFLVQAEEAAKDEKDLRVLKFTNRAIQLDSNLTRAYVLRSTAEARLRRFKEAFADANRAIKLDPKNAEAYVLRGKAGYLGDGESVAAVRDLEKGVRLNPNVKDGYFNLAVAYTATKSLNKALECFNKAEKLKPKDPWIFRYRSALYSMLGQNDKALVDLNTLIKIDARGEHYEARAGQYKLLKQPDKALADLSTAIELEPSQYSYMIQRADLYRKSGRHKEAIADYSQSIKLNAFDEDLFLYRGQEYLVLKQYEKAILDFNEAIDLAPDYAPAFKARSAAYSATGKKDLAARDTARAIEISKRPAEKKI